MTLNSHSRFIRSLVFLKNACVIYRSLRLVSLLRRSEIRITVSSIRKGALVHTTLL